MEELTIASHNERRSPEHTSKTEDALGYGLTAHGIREFFNLHSERHDTLEFLDISRLEEYKYENRISFRILESLSLLSKLNTVWFNLNLFNAASESASRPIQLNWPAGMEPRSDSCVTSVRIHASCWDTARNGDPLVVYFRRYFPNASEVFFEGWGGKNEDNLRTMLMEKEVKTKPKFVLPGFMKIGSKKITCFSSEEFGSLRLLSADGIGSDLLDTLLEVEEVRLSGLTPAFRFPLPDPVVVINFTIGLKRLVLEGGPDDSLPFSLVTDILKFCLDLRELYVWCKHISGASDDKLSQVLERRWLVANNRLEVFYLASVVEKVNLTEASVNLVLRQCTESLSCLGLITTWNVVSLDSDRISIENDVFVARSCDYSVKPYEKPDPLDHVSNLFHHL